MQISSLVSKIYAYNNKVDGARGVMKEINKAERLI